MLFDEIENASDSLWNLLPGILDKGTLTLGDNRRVDFSRALIFMTSNLGVREMTDVIALKLGFGADDQRQSISSDARLKTKIANAGVEAARRRFSPEFINRLDKIAVFKPLGDAELRKILDIELRMLQQHLDPRRLRHIVLQLLESYRSDIGFSGSTRPDWKVVSPTSQCASNKNARRSHRF